MTITLEPELQSKLERLAHQLGRPAADIADEAIRAHLEELVILALEEEERAYQQLYTELYTHYSGQVVAVFGGRVIDVDPDFETLFLRVQKRYPDQAVLIRRVSESPQQEYRFRSPRLEHPA
jgi:hypothetical protein